MNKFSVLAVACAASMAAPSFGAEVLLNGGFESPTAPPPCCTTTPPTDIPGWSVVAGDVNVVLGTFSSTNGNLAQQGDQYLDLIGQSGAGSISQTFTTVAGRTYALSFAYSHNLFSGLQLASADFSVDGLAGSVTHTGGSTNDLNWLTYSGSFVASGSSATLNFTNTVGAQNEGVFLDAVSVMGPVPEPATWAMLVLGFGLVGGAIRSGRRSTPRFA